MTEKRPVFDPTVQGNIPQFPSEEWFKETLGEDYRQLVSQQLYSVGLLDEGEDLKLDPVKNDNQVDDRHFLYEGVIKGNFVSVCLLKDDGYAATSVNPNSETDIYLLKGSLVLTLYYWESGEKDEFIELTEDNNHFRIEPDVHFMVHSGIIDSKDLAFYIEVTPISDDQTSF